jgi:hypothetical protein
MDYTKYKTDGWGLSELALSKLSESIDSIEKGNIKVVEFGSGASTRFLVDLGVEIEKNLQITSFDNDPSYSYNGSGVLLHMRNLVECDDETYEKMFTDKVYKKELMRPKTSELSTRQKNNFYDINEGDLDGIYDVMVLDGPNGNGRNISFLHMKEHLKSGSYVLIDDFPHYDFVERFLSIFDAELIFKHNNREDGGEFVIYKIK